MLGTRAAVDTVVFQLTSSRLFPPTDFDFSFLKVPASDLSAQDLCVRLRQAQGLLPKFPSSSAP